VSRAADALTLARLAAGVALPVALARSVDRSGAAWTPVGLWTVGAATDLLDGPLARRLGGGTRHGAFLDSAADVVFVLGAAVAGVAVGMLSAWVPAAIAVAVGAYAVASLGTRSGPAARAYTPVGHAAGVCNYLLAGLLAAAVARPAWRPLLDGAQIAVVAVNVAAALVQAAAVVKRARARRGAERPGRSAHSPA